MNYLFCYLQLGGFFLVIFSLICLIDAFIINDLDHTIHMVIKKPYEGYRDILKILDITGTQVILWPLSLTLLVSTILFIMYCSWKERKQLK